MATFRIPNGNGLEPLSPGGTVALAFQTGRAAGVDALDEMGLDIVPPDRHHPAEKPAMDEKKTQDDEICPVDSVEDGESSISVGKGLTAADKVGDMEKIGIYAIHVDDDPSLSPWTFRTIFLGMLISNFALLHMDVCTYLTSMTLFRHWSVMLLCRAVSLDTTMATHL
jgi:hypothetical protein